VKPHSCDRIVPIRRAKRRSVLLGDIGESDVPGGRISAENEVEVLGIIARNSGQREQRKFLQCMNRGKLGGRGNLWA